MLAHEVTTVSTSYFPTRLLEYEERDTALLIYVKKRFTEMTRVSANSILYEDWHVRLKILGFKSPLRGSVPRQLSGRGIILLVH